jgi:hypothetical protein
MLVNLITVFIFACILVEYYFLTNYLYIGIAGESGDTKSRRKEGESDEFEAFAQSRTSSSDAIKNRLCLVYIYAYNKKL